jgi:hypothetical protein
MTVTSNRVKNTLPRKRNRRKLKFWLESKGDGLAAKCRVIRAEVLNGRVLSQVEFYRAQYIEGWHEWWDWYRAEKAALQVMRLGQAMAGVPHA